MVSVTVSCICAVLNHRQACVAVASWFMTLGWCDFAAVETAGRPTGQPHRADHLTMGAFLRAMKAWEKRADAGGGVLDVLALTTPRLDHRRARAVSEWERQHRYAQSRGLAFGRRKPPPIRPRVAIAEVKVQRSDLFRDLRAGKMLRYQSQASHVYLAATSEVLEDVDLEDRGLPPWWGVVRVGQREVFSVRNPKRYEMGCDPHLPLRAALLNKAAISLAHRAVK